jgi:hypothetical protein
MGPLFVGLMVIGVGILVHSLRLRGCLFWMVWIVVGFMGTGAMLWVLGVGGPSPISNLLLRL